MDSPVPCLKGGSVSASEHDKRAARCLGEAAVNVDADVAIYSLGYAEITFHRCGFRGCRCRDSGAAVRSQSSHGSRIFSDSCACHLVGDLFSEEEPRPRHVLCGEVRGQVAVQGGLRQFVDHDPIPLT